MRPIVHTALTPEAARVVSMAQPRSPWHSPVPYLFGGLAAMLGLIAFALLILACSYWRLSRDETQQHNEGNDLESGGKLDGVSKMSDPPVFEEKIVVIMAGNEKPTFLATPALMFKHTSDDHDHDHKHDRNVAKDEHEEDDEKSKEDQQHS